MKTFLQKIVQFFRKEKQLVTSSSNPNTPIQNDVLRTSTNEKSELNLSDIFAIPIQNISVDFLVNYTAFGEVLSIECLLLKLPKAAQKMILGKVEMNADFQKAIEQAKLYLNYLIPLAKAGLIELPQVKKHESWQKNSLTDAIEHLTKHDQQRKLSALFIEIRDCNLDTTIRLASIKKFIEQADNFFNFFHTERKNSITPHPILIRSIFPHLRYRAYIEALKLLDKNLTETTQQFLLPYAIDNKFGRHRYYILKMLSKPKSEAIHKELIYVYQCLNYPNVQHTHFIIKGLGRYQTPESERIIWDLFRHFAKEYSGQAMQVLLDWGVSEEQILSELTEIIQHSTRPHRVEAAYFFAAKLKARNALGLSWLEANYIDNRRAHPPTFFRESLQILTHYYPQRKDANLTELSNLMTSFLNHSNDNYIKLGLSCCTSLINQQIATNVESILQQTQQLLSHPTVEIQVAVLDFYVATSKKYDHNALLKPFIKIAFKRHPQLINRAIKMLNLLNTNPTRGKFNAQLKDVYLKKLAATEREILSTTLEGLSTFTDIDILLRLRQLKNSNMLPSYMHYRINTAINAAEQRLKKQKS